jgi:hypothetical protein
LKLLATGGLNLGNTPKEVQMRVVDDETNAKNIYAP